MRFYKSKILRPLMWIGVELLQAEDSVDMQLQDQNYYFQYEREDFSPAADSASFAVLTDQSRTLQKAIEQNIYTAMIQTDSELYLEGTELIFTAYDELDFDSLQEYMLRKQGRRVVIAETERLEIAEIQHIDIESLCQISKKKGMQYLQMSETDFFLPDYLYHYSRTAYQWNGYGIWAVRRKEDARLIGCGGLSEKIWKNGISRVEMQYMIDPLYWKKGYAFELCNAIISYVINRTDLEEVWLRIHKENAASIALAEKLGAVRLKCEYGMKDQVETIDTYRIRIDRRIKTGR